MPKGDGKIRAGDLIHRVDIETEGSTRDSTTGEPIPAWNQHLQKVPCEIMDQGGDEVVRADQVESRIDVIIRMRNPGEQKFPTPKMRAVTRHQTPARTFNIRRVQRKDARARELWLYCTETP